jgi:DNA polymerase-3 subunit epsilon
MEALPIIVFDVETTGTDKRRDQVIELCVQFGVDPGSPSETWRIKPSVPISPGAQEVHGISMEDLAECPSFTEVADEIRHIFDRAQALVGYNISFDIEMLQAEYARAGQPLLDLSSKEVVDAFRLWQQCEPRSLQDAHRRFVGSEFSAAHSASADVAATGRVLRGMMNHFKLNGDWSDIALVCEPNRALWIGPSRHIQWADGKPSIGFGKHQGTPLLQLAHGPDSGYLRWILDKDFPRHVHDICRAAFDLSPDEFTSWIRRQFGEYGAGESLGQGFGDGKVAQGTSDVERLGGARAVS